MAVNPSAAGTESRSSSSRTARLRSGTAFLLRCRFGQHEAEHLHGFDRRHANTNPVVLNALGNPTTQIWFTAGQSYKVVYAPSTDTDPPTSPIWTIDNLTGINDVTVASQSEWVAGPTPTYVALPASPWPETRPARSPRVAGSRRPIAAGRSTRPSRIRCSVR
jgi:hypothetical protein